MNIKGETIPAAPSARAFAALAAAGSLWGTGFLLGKWALIELSVGHMVLYRLLFASLGFAPVTWPGLRRAETRIAREDIRLILIAALVGIPVLFLIQFAGLARTTVSHASRPPELSPDFRLSQGTDASPGPYELPRRQGWPSVSRGWKFQS